MIILSLGSRRPCRLSCPAALHQDVILQLIYGMERRIHPVSHMHGAQRTQAQPRNAEAREVRSRKAPLRSAQTRSMQSNPPPQANSPMWRLGWEPRNIGRWPQSNPDLAASPSSVPSRATGLRTGQQSRIRPRGFFNFEFLVTLSLATVRRATMRHFHSMFVVGPKDRIPAWIRIDREPCQAAPDSGRPLSRPCRVMR